MSLLSNILLFRKAYKRGKRVNRFASFACQTADNCDKSYSINSIQVNSHKH